MHFCALLLFLVAGAHTAAAQMIGSFWSAADRDFFDPPAATSDAATINWAGFPSNMPPNVAGIGSSDWAGRWTGLLTVPISGAYTFCFWADDGVRFFLGCPPTRLANAWSGKTGSGAYRETCTTATFLTAGVPAPVTIEYMQMTYSTYLSWKYVNGTQKLNVPSNWLNATPRGANVCPCSFVAQDSPMQLACPSGYGIDTINPKSSYGLPSILYASDFSSSSPRFGSDALYANAQIVGQALQLIPLGSNKEGVMVIAPPAPVNSFYASFKFLASVTSGQGFEFGYGGPSTSANVPLSSCGFVNGAHKCDFYDGISSGISFACDLGFYSNWCGVSYNNQIKSAISAPDLFDGQWHTIDMWVSYASHINVLLDDVLIFDYVWLTDNYAPASNWVFFFGAGNSYVGSSGGSFTVDDIRIESDQACPNYENVHFVHAENPQCAASDTVSRLTSTCYGLQNCSLIANQTFASPCNDTALVSKSLIASATCSRLSAPYVSDVSPSVGFSPTNITISGGFFLDVPSALNVTVGGFPCPVISSLYTQRRIVCMASFPVVIPGTYPVVVARSGITMAAPFPLFTLVLQSNVTSIQPAGGAAGTVVTIFGANFGSSEADLVVRFGNSTGTVVAGSLNVAATAFAALAPTPLGPGTVNITVLRFGLPARGSASFLYVDPPVIQTLSAVSITVGANILINATGLGSVSANIAVTIGGSATPLQQISISGVFTVVTVVVPPLSPGTVSAVVFRYGVPSAPAMLSISQPSGVALYAVSPTGVQPGMEILLQGGGFGTIESAISVSLTGLTGGNCPIVAGSLNSIGTQVRCVIPAGGVVGTSYSVHISAGTSAVGPGVVYVGTPSISSVQPAGGQQGLMVTIQGSNFGTVEANVQILFGFTSATLVTGSLNDTHLLALVPSLPLGAQDVTVRVYNSIENALPKPTFTMSEQPRLLSVSPAGGAAGQAATTLTLTGSSLGCDEAVIVISVGSSPCAIVAGSLLCATEPQLLQCVVQNLDVGVYSVNLVRFGSVTAKFPLPTFEAVDAAVVTSIIPTGGLPATEISVYGNGFGTQETQLVALVGSQQCSIISGSLNTLGTFFKCLVPLQTGLSVLGQVTISRYGVSAAYETPVTFQYIQQPVVSAVTPVAGLAGTAVTMRGTSLYPDSLLGGHVVVSVGGVAADIDPDSYVISSTELVFVAPDLGAVLGPQPVVLSVFGVAQLGSVAFTYIAAPVISSIAPLSVRPGSSITLRGFGFGVDVAPLEVAVAFPTGDSELCNITRVSVSGAETLLVCDLPAPSACAGLTDVDLWICASGVANVSVSRYAVPAVAPVALSLFANATLLAVNPVGGLSGSVVSLTGAGFGTASADLAAVAMTSAGSPVACSVTAASENLVVCRLADSAAGVLTFSLSRFGFLAQVPEAVRFEVVDQPTVLSFSPAGSSVNISTPVTISLFGAFFGADESALSISIGSAPCDVVAGSLSVTGRDVQCTLLPNNLPLGPNAVVLRRFGVAAAAPAVFAAELQHSIASVTPQGGQVGQQVSVTVGSVLHTSIASEWVVTIGGVPASLYSFDSVNTVITVSVPALPATSGVFPVGVLRFGHVSAVRDDVFAVVEPPTLISLSPDGGAAGTRLTLTGSKMANSEALLQVTLGGLVCPIESGSLRNASGDHQSLVCIVPAAAPGLQDVTLASYSLVATTLLRFEEIQEPLLISVSPRGGASIGNSTLTLTGQGFGSVGGERNLAVMVGSSPCVIVPGSLNLIGSRVLCVVEGGGRAGVGFPVVASVFGVESNADVLFDFIEPPAITSIAPRGGVPGSLLTVSGVNFGTIESELSIVITDWTRTISAACPVVPGTLTTGPSVNGTASSSVLCTVPTLPVGVGNTVFIVTLTLFGVLSTEGDSSEASQVAVVSTAPRLLSVQPLFGRSGDTISIVGDGFFTSGKASRRAEPAVVVTIGGIECTGIAPLTPTLTLCIVPEGLEDGAQEVALFLFGTPADVQDPVMFEIFTKPAFIGWDSAPAQAYAVMLALFLAIMLAVMVFYIRNRGEVRINRQQPVFCIVTQAGCMLGLFLLVPFVGEPTASLCLARMWLPPIAFTLVYAALFAKTWRVYRIFHNPSLKLITITTGDMLIKICGLLFLDVVLLVLWSSISPLKPNLYLSQGTVYATCSSNKSSLFFAIFLVIKFALLFGGAVLSFQARAVKSAFSESKYIAFSIYNELFVAVFLLPVGASVNSPQLAFTLFFMGLFLILTATFGSLFVRNVWMLTLGKTSQNPDNAEPQSSIAMESLQPKFGVSSSKAQHTQSSIAASDI
eukprot:TRINITY_DN2478_c0_g1_i4.p1 TRINITY_DN2478_c0_g1~~TRINITY_DN2478_c0_g1_i4.p1  ORF type:complete len:2291 (-),score=491.13 TRINITY_DN2478_c0_g1_i4:25-6897(-)